MKFQVRLGTLADLPLIRELVQECALASVPETRKIAPASINAMVDLVLAELKRVWSTASSFKLLLLEDTSNRKIVGYLFLLVNQLEASTGEKQTVVSDMGISPRYRGKVLWKLLLGKAEELARENNDDYLTGMITVSNKASLAIAEKWGFQIERYQMAKPLT